MNENEGAPPEELTDAIPGPRIDLAFIHKVIGSVESDLKMRQIFPSLELAGSELIGDAIADVRAKHLLTRLRIVCWEDLLDYRARDFLRVTNLGVGTLEKILIAVAQRNLDAYRNPEGIRIPVVLLHGIRKNRGLGKESHDPLVLAVTQLTRWAVTEREASSFEDLLKLIIQEAEIPEDLYDVRSIIRESRLTRGDLGRAIEPDLLVRLFASLDRGGDIIANRRILTSDRPTLEALGQRLGLSRERVRQLEVRALSQIDEMLRQPDFLPIRWRTFDVKQEFGKAIRRDSRRFEVTMAHAVRGLDNPPCCSAQDFFLWMIGPYLERGEWLMAPGFSPETAESEIRRMASDSWLLSKGRVIEYLCEIGVTFDDFEEVQSLLTEWRDCGDGWLVQGSGTPADKMEIVLRLRNEALPIEVLSEGNESSSARAYLQGVLSTDTRFVRTDIENHFALREWIGEELGSANKEALQTSEGGSQVFRDAISVDFGLIVGRTECPYCLAKTGMSCDGVAAKWIHESRVGLYIDGSGMAPS